ncbi:MAG: hypothetical protein AAF512_08730, partial [Pseudomonadota bacterium]
MSKYIKFNKKFGPSLDTWTEAKEEYDEKYNTYRDLGDWNTLQQSNKKLWQDMAETCFIKDELFTWSKVQGVNHGSMNFAQLTAKYKAAYPGKDQFNFGDPHDDIWKNCAGRGNCGDENDPENLAQLKRSFGEAKSGLREMLGNPTAYKNCFSSTNFKGSRAGKKLTKSANDKAEKAKNNANTYYVRIGKMRDDVDVKELKEALNTAEKKLLEIYK